MRARALAVVVLLLSYGAVGARQPAVRVAVPLPAPARDIADALEIASIDRSQFLLDVIRTLFSVGLVEGDPRQRMKLRDLIASPQAQKGELVPLPLDPSIWRETLLPRQAQLRDDQIIGAILSDRTMAMLYHGLAGLDDDTLAWIGPERDLLRSLVKHAGTFGVFGPSVRVQAGKVLVPGGPDAEPLWQAIVGADPAKPAAFIRRLFDSDNSGQLAWFYDSIAQLDDARIRFATSARQPQATRIERTRALLDICFSTGREWKPEQQPFTRRPLDPALTLGLIAVDADGGLIGPTQRGVWERVFNNEDGAVPAPAVKEANAGSEPARIDAAWLVSRIHQAPIEIGRRRLETFLFAQRMFPEARTADTEMVTALRAHMAFPALMATLERAGVRSTATMIPAIDRAIALNAIGDEQRRRAAIIEFQSALGILERMSRAGGLTTAQVSALITSLSQVETSNRGYEGRLAVWIRKDLLPGLHAASRDTADSNEDAILSAMAGVKNDAEGATVEWEGRKYRVSSARGELTRLHRVRERQGGATLSVVLSRMDKADKPDKGGEAAELALADTLASILYAAHLGDPEGPALTSGNIALHHDLGTGASLGVRGAWHLPSESHTARGWRISGSMLGLDVALARMSLRRMDTSVMPPEPRLVSAERQTAALSVAFLTTSQMTDAARDEIAAALARGRARLEGLTGDRVEVERLARDAGLSAWRREALAWALTHDRAQVASQLSLLELMWVGKPRASQAISLDGWGAATLPIDGCLCLAMPRALPWETLIGRPALGLLATRGADVAILVADTLSSLKMPAELAPGVIAFVMQEVVDQARPSHFDDWPEFSRAATAVSHERLVDYVAAQAAGGALQLARQSQDRDR
jgi:hypothetical protein